MRVIPDAPAGAAAPARSGRPSCTRASASQDRPFKMQEHYDPEVIERDVQARWDTDQVFRAVEDETREKFYCLSMFPYPSGRLHMGHVRNYTIGDAISRHQRMLGKNVLQPMGWDAFGLPAENAAISHNVAPAKWTRENITYMRDQLKRLGFAYDWARELATCDADYYRWEQWFFTRLMDEGLAYRRLAEVNWDPVDQTVLANEQVIEGRGWRSGAVIERREIPQWFLKITDYAPELLEAIDGLDAWPEAVKTMQRHWIGRSEGLAIRFELDSGGEIEVFTTRPDTLMGATYLAVAAEHPTVRAEVDANPALAAFVESCRHASTAEADLETMEKRGFELAVRALHPITGEALPVFAANFVLAGYGTGAVMSVPAHDERDFEFANRYDLPIRVVVYPDADTPPDLGDGAFTDYGVTANSAPFDGLDFRAAFDAIADRLAAEGRAERRVQFRLRDWGVSRQRYWGCPIPVIYNDDGSAEPAREFPVTLPEDVAFEGVSSPLKDMAEFTAATNAAGAKARRETDTFDTFMESSWYYARFTCPDAQRTMLDARADYWLPVDVYVGGIEHAVLHLLYARFYHKLLRDAGLVSSDEPFRRLITQGMVCAETFYREGPNGRRQYFNPAEVSVTTDDKGAVVGATLEADGQPVVVGPIEKMSKSKNNGVDPEGLVRAYGADTVRLYMMFAAPPEQSLEWSAAGVEGAYRFLKRLWRLVHGHVEAGLPISTPDPSTLERPLADVRRQVHQTIAKVSDDYARRYTFNTAIAAVMELTNALAKLTGDDAATKSVRHEGLETSVLLLAPIVPHVTEALWAALGHEAPLTDARWPVPDPEALVADEVLWVVQVNGKKRAELTLPANTPAADVEARARADDNVARHLEGGTVRKVIVVEKRSLINVVVG